MRIDKFISNTGFGSRKEVKSLLKAGAVKINDITVKSPQTHVDIEKDVVTLYGEEIIYREYIYLMMNKPPGVISATEDKYDETVIDLLDEEFQHFEPFPVGRLDKDTEGLLLLTNDGQLAHKLLSPKKKVPKKYFVRINTLMTNEMVTEVQRGIELDDGYLTMPGDLEILESGNEGFITIMEGKFHQIKRMFIALGSKVTYLKRVEMAGMKLDENLELGEYRELTEDELEYIRTT
ncbi:MAG: pseudouridine synthase [Bacillales bacterium]|nr:pseudouridine synthase [Bacillales bacterium]